MVTPPTARVASVQYPHHLYLRIRRGEDMQDETGAWVPAPSAWEYAGRCREESAGKPATVQTAGGEFTAYSSTVYLPKGPLAVPEGAEIAVTEHRADPAEIDGTEPAGIRIKGRCSKFDKGRLHSRLWV